MRPKLPDTMTPNEGDRGEQSGPIAYMASNGVAANLLMWCIVAAGLMALTGLEREAWPAVRFNQFEVSVPYPGATPEEVEEAIVVKIENQVSGLSQVEAVRSVAAPGDGVRQGRNEIGYGHGQRAGRHRVGGRPHSDATKRSREAIHKGDDQRSEFDPADRPR